LALKLAELGNDVHLREFKLMPHGFFSYNFPFFGMKDESMKAIKCASEVLQELISL